MSEGKKNLFEKAIDALTTRDEKEAAEKAKAQALAAQKEAAELRAKLDAEKAALVKAASEKAALQMAAKAAAEKAAVERLAESKAAAEKAALAAAPKKGVVTTRSLRVRKDHNTTAEVVAGLVDGNEVIILEMWSDGKNTWAKLENGWAAMVYNGETYIRLA